MLFEELNSKLSTAYNMGQGGGGDIWKIQEGENKVRIVRNEYGFQAAHWFQKKKLGDCPGINNGCKFCLDEQLSDQARKPSKQFYLYIIDRKDQQIKIAQVPWSVVKSIEEWRIKPSYEFNEDGLPKYDMIFSKIVDPTKQPPSNTSYTVTPERTDTPLSREEVEAILKLDPIDKVIERLGGKKETTEDPNDPATWADDPFKQ